MFNRSETDSFDKLTNSLPLTYPKRVLQEKSQQIGIDLKVLVKFFISIFWFDFYFNGCSIYASTPFDFSFYFVFDFNFWVDCSIEACGVDFNFSVIDKIPKSKTLGFQFLIYNLTIFCNFKVSIPSIHLCKMWCDKY